jgi:hypothetical protein
MKYQHTQEEIEAIWRFAVRGGLAMNPTNDWTVWAEDLEDYSLGQIREAVKALRKASDTGAGRWLRTAGDIIQHTLSYDEHDKATLKRMIARNPSQTTSLADLLTVRQLLAMNECGCWSMDWGNGNSFERKALEERFLANCRRPRPEHTHEVLDSPATPWLEWRRGENRRQIAAREGYAEIPYLVPRETGMVAGRAV